MYSAKRVSYRPQVRNPIPEAIIPPREQDGRSDHFVESGGKVFAGHHLIIDLWGAQRLTDLQWIEATLRHCVTACNATLLHIHLHHFSENEGISGVAVLAESHISIHTWPERDYAALDVFMCGNAVPENAIKVLEQALLPEKTVIKRMLRGEVSP